jgi:putative flippase GtrA
LPALDLKREAGLIARFGGAGVVTTALGLAVILALDVGLGLDRRLANAAGYLVGASLGLFLQGRFVFRDQARGPGVARRYVAVMLFAFGLNQAVLTLAGVALPQTRLGHTLAQLMAMGTYTATQFVLFRVWVFRAARA